MSVETWKAIADWATIFLIALTVVSGSAALILGDRINEKQADQLRQFDEDLTGAKTELAKQQERAARAESGITDAKKSAADALRDAGLANERAESLRARNLELEKILSPRILSLKNVDELKKFAGTKVILVSIHDAEALHAAGSIKWFLENAGWNVVVTVPVDPFFQSVKIPDGVTLVPAKEFDSIRNEKLSRVLINALTAQGWKEVTPGSENMLPDWKEFAILVGFKPPAYELLK